MILNYYYIYLYHQRNLNQYNNVYNDINQWNMFSVLNLNFYKIYGIISKNIILFSYILNIFLIFSLFFSSSSNSSFVNSFSFSLIVLWNTVKIRKIFLSALLLALIFDIPFIIYLIKVSFFRIIYLVFFLS